MTDQLKEESYYNLAISKEKYNINQAYLAYQHAKFYADAKNKSKYESKMQELNNQPECMVSNVSVVILSYQDLQTTKQCIESIRENEDMSCLELIVVDNASTDGSANWLKEQKDCKVLLNDKNMGFPKGCNQGIELSEKENDILLLNNDTLVPQDAIFWLRMGLYESSDTASAGSVSNCVPNYQNTIEMQVDPSEYKVLGEKYNVMMEAPYELKSWLVGFCLLIKRTALEEVGYLDEQFSPGNFEDNDMGIRLNHHSYKQRLCKNSFVFHYGSKSFSKKEEKITPLHQTNMKKYMDKWGIHPYNHTYIRTELLSFMPQTSDDSMRILEVGCGCGATLGRLRTRYKNADILGVEKEDALAKIASQIEQVRCADIMDLTKEEIGTFDYILLGGIFEHNPDLNTLLAHIKSLLSAQGKIISSVYNFMNPHILKRIADGTFAYEEDGILDHRHIRFYTIQTVLNEFAATGLEVIDLSYQKNELTEDEASFFNEICKNNHGIDPNLYLAYQFVLVSR